MYLGETVSWDLYIHALSLILGCATIYTVSVEYLRNPY